MMISKEKMVELTERILFVSVWLIWNLANCDRLADFTSLNFRFVNLNEFTEWLSMFNPLANNGFFIKFLGTSSSNPRSTSPFFSPPPRPSLVIKTSSSSSNDTAVVRSHAATCSRNIATHFPIPTSYKLTNKISAAASEPEEFRLRQAVLSLSSRSRRIWKGEMEMLPLRAFWSLRRILEVSGIPKILSWTKGVGEVRKEKVEEMWLKWSLDLRTGWEFWSLWRAFSRRWRLGGSVEDNARIAMPVPPGTARHQAVSVEEASRRRVSECSIWENPGAGEFEGGKEGRSCVLKKRRVLILCWGIYRRL